MKIMKHLFNIILAAVSLFAVVSCVDPLNEGWQNTKQPDLQLGLEGTRLTLGFNVPMPVATKAMTEDPKIDSIHVFVFVDNGVSDNGVLLEVQKAELGGYVNKNAEANDQGKIVNTGSNIMIARWKVNLLMGRTKRRLHFVANLPQGFEIPEAGAAEFSVMRAIQTTGGDVAYWQMVELEDGVLAYTYDGTGNYSFVDDSGVKQTLPVSRISGFKSMGENGTYIYTTKDANNRDIDIEVAKNDYITAEGHKVLDGKGFYASDQLSDAVSEIPLIRNFARIKVLTTSNSENTGLDTKFHLQSAVLINTPKYGFAVPFDDKNNRFVPAYKSASFANLPVHNTILASGYPATIPSNTIETACPASAFPAKHLTVGSDTRDSVILYMYERGIPTENATTLLVSGTLGSSTEVRWFKIEVSDEKGDFFPIYRDFTYNVEIKSIVDSNGYDDMEEAYDGVAVGDISNSPETKDLPRVTNGDGLTMWVEYIDYTSVKPNGDTVTLLYKFFDAEGNYTGSVIPEIVEVTGRTPAVTSISYAPYSGTNTPDSEGGWYQATVTLDAAAGATKMSKIRVSGTHDNKTLYRDVRYQVMVKQALTIKATNLTSEDKGDTTTLSITLPRYLSYSVFPLTLKIESAKNNMNPGDDENLSVESGPSLVTNSTKNSFQFLKTINYSDYHDSEDPAQRTYTVVLKTTREGSDSDSNATTLYVTDKGGYFNVASCNVTVGGSAFRFSGTGVEVDASTETATFSIISRVEEGEDPVWTLTPSSNLTISSVVTKAPAGVPVTGTGDADITVTFPANESTTQDNEYTVTATREDLPDVSIEFKITQKKKVIPHYTINLDAGGDNTTYGYAWETTTVNPNSNSYLSYRSTNHNVANSLATMSVTVVGYTEFTVYIRSYAQSNRDYIVVRKVGSNYFETWNRSSAYNDSGTKDHTSDRQQSGTALTNYRAVTFNSSDGLTYDDTPHTFYIQFGKNGNTNDGDDRGYVLIPKEYTVQQ